LKIINTAAAKSPVTDTDKTDLQAALVAIAKPVATAAEVRAALPAGRRAKWTDGFLHQAALDLGLKVERE